MENNKHDIDRLFSDESKSAEENTVFSGFDRVWEKVESRLDEKKETKIFKLWLPYTIAASLAIVFGSLYFFNQDEKNIQKPVMAKNTVKKIDNDVATLVNEENNVAIRNLDAKIKQKVQTQIVDNKPIIAYNQPKNENEFISNSIIKETYTEVQSAPKLEENANAKVEFSGDKLLSQNSIEEESVRISEEARAKEKMVMSYQAKVADSQNIRLAQYSDKGSTDEIDEGNFENVKISTDKNQSPLYVVDGYVADSEFIKNYNLKKITSLNIVEGKNAVKLYGNYGKKGVVVITTKGLSTKEQSVLKANSEKYNLPN